MHCNKILIVEDDESIRDILVEALANEGYRVVPARHGKEALRLLKEREKDPCLILTDLIMPEMDGWTLLSHLKEQDVLITIPVVAMTAASHPKTENTQSVIKKPFDLDELIKIVKEHCGSPNEGPIVINQTFL